MAPDGAYDINGDGPFVRNGITIEWVLENFKQRGPDVYWRKQNRRGNRKMNKPAGIIPKGKRRRRIYSTGIRNRCILAHHVAFALKHGRFPRHNMDIRHIDGDGSNNCPSNLREVKREAGSWAAPGLVLGNRSGTAPHFGEVDG